MALIWLTVVVFGLMNLFAYNHIIGMYMALTKKIDESEPRQDALARLRGWKDDNQ